MISKNSPPPIVRIEAPDIKLEPKVDVRPIINVAPSEVRIQTMPAPKVDVQVPQSRTPWHFRIIRDNDGNMTDVIATPQ